MKTYLELAAQHIPSFSPTPKAKRKPLRTPPDPLLFLATPAQLEAFAQAAVEERGGRLQRVAPAVAAIEFATGPIGSIEGLEFLRAWMHGDWDVIRSEWPEAPAAVFPPAPVDPWPFPAREAVYIIRLPNGDICGQRTARSATEAATQYAKDYPAYKRVRLTAELKGGA
ncbi:hypothetical protein D3C87_475820 [compost metagenome]